LGAADFWAFDSMRPPPISAPLPTNAVKCEMVLS
jgi:hypothetical protein